MPRLLLDPQVVIQEQAWSIARNLTEDEQGVELVVSSLGIQALLNLLAIVLSSPNDDPVEQVLFLSLSACHPCSNTDFRPHASLLT
jgi:hypothetical protein